MFSSKVNGTKSSAALHASTITNSTSVCNSTIVLVFGVKELERNALAQSFALCEISWLFLGPALITAPAENDLSLIAEREQLEFESEVVFQCEYRGVPTPRIMWYHNGERVETGSGIRESSRQLVISRYELQLNRSGVYQCIVSNIIDGMTRMDSRQWMLKVRPPGECR